LTYLTFVTVCKTSSNSGLKFLEVRACSWIMQCVRIAQGDFWQIEAWSPPWITDTEHALSVHTPTQFDRSRRSAVMKLSIIPKMSWALLVPLISLQRSKSSCILWSFYHHVLHMLLNECV
jgi:hypothetical protein